MIFKIADGREYFYQWDIDRQIIVSDPTIKEVHFCNRTDDCSLVVEVADGVANVPNIILQKSFDVRVFGYDGKATLHEATFKVKARTQPADYVYTETVVKSIEEILEAAETVTTTANEFYEFVEDHTLGLTDDGEGNVELVAVDEGVDLTEYYTKTEVNELIENIDIPETDLTGYATEEYVDAAVKSVEVDESKFASKDHSHSYSSLTGKPVIPSIEGLASEEYVDEAVKNVKPDLTGYATEKYVDDAIAGIEIPEAEPTDLSNYYTKEETYSKTEVDDLINNIEIPEGGGGAGTPLYQHTVYVGADLMNMGRLDPSVYVTFVCDKEDQFTFESFANYLQTTESELAISGTVFSSNSNKAEYIPLDFIKGSSKENTVIVSYRTASTTSTDTPKFTEISITAAQAVGFNDTVVCVGTASVSGGGDADLSNYYTKAEVDNLIPDTSSFITEVPAEYITETELNSKGYLTEHQSLGNYYTKEETAQAIQDALNAIGVAEGGAY
jgi:hypothetical protein